MFKPFYQGKLDTFCAIYAVLNALRLTHGIRTLKARDILNDTLMALAARPEALRAVLNQDTNYIQLVDGMRRAQQRAFPLGVETPFTERDRPSPDDLWEVCRQWLAAERKRAVILRFMRHLTADGPAVNRHWTVIDRMDENSLHLFDCSHEAEAILNIRRDAFVTDPTRVSKEQLLIIQPESIRLLRLPF